MQSVQSKIWTRVAVSVSYDDNYYTTVVFVSYVCTLDGLIKCALVVRVGSLLNVVFEKLILKVKMFYSTRNYSTIYLDFLHYFP